MKLVDYVREKYLSVTDYMYVRKIFFLDGQSYEISWVENHHSSINGNKIKGKGTYDL